MPTEETAVPERNIPEAWERDSELSAPLLSVAFKVLISAISFAIFALLEVVLLIICLAANDASFVNLNFGALTPLGTVGAIIFILLIITVAVSFVRILIKPRVIEKVYRLHQIITLILLFCVFITCACVVMMLVHNINVSHPIAVDVLAVVFALLSFIPITATWHIKNEERLKNFIDALSKAFSCMAVISGAIALMIKLLVQF